VDERQAYPGDDNADRNRTVDGDWKELARGHCELPAEDRDGGAHGERRAGVRNGAFREGQVGAGAAGAGANGMPGYTQADIDALLAFQQEMVRLSMAASGGDAAAKARLESWETLALGRQQEMQTLSIAASAGDAVAVQKLQQIQCQLMREWMSTGGVKPVKKSKKP
jgi:hypothetical protein